MTPEHRRQTAERALPLLDLTNLEAGCTHDDIDRLCARAVTPHGHVAAICIWPRYVSHAHSRLGDGDVAIATVVNFPEGNADAEIVRVETRQAISDGADEIDLVMPYRAFAAGDRDTARAMIADIRDACGEAALLKVILETGELAEDSLIADASAMAIGAGADFIKTSTGKVAVNATPHASEIMLKAIAESGRLVGFKPAGGIRTTADAAAYLALADRIMGIEWASPRTLRFGASSLLDDLLAAFDGQETSGATGY